MRGNDLTQAQLDAAEQFILLMRSKTNDLHPTGDQQIAQRWCDLVCIVALYGAIRAKAVADGNPADVAGITIYHGDCREILPTLAYDVVLSDPPYGIAHPTDYAKRGPVPAMHPVRAYAEVA